VYRYAALAAVVGPRVAAEPMTYAAASCIAAAAAWTMVGEFGGKDRIAG
jgi:hypothetical protein